MESFNKLFWNWFCIVVFCCFFFFVFFFFVLFFFGNISINDGGYKIKRLYMNNTVQHGTVSLQLNLHTECFADMQMQSIHLLFSLIIWLYQKMSWRHQMKLQNKMESYLNKERPNPNQVSLSGPFSKNACCDLKQTGTHKDYLNGEKLGVWNCKVGGVVLCFKHNF